MHQEVSDISQDFLSRSVARGRYPFRFKLRSRRSIGGLSQQFPGYSCSGACDKATAAVEINESHTGTLDPSERVGPEVFLVARTPYPAP